jgi:hypothetical protein
LYQDVVVKEDQTILLECIPVPMMLILLLMILKLLLLLQGLLQTTVWWLWFATGL